MAPDFIYLLLVVLIETLVRKIFKRFKRVLNIIIVVSNLLHACPTISVLFLSPNTHTEYYI